MNILISHEAALKVQECTCYPTADDGFVVCEKMIEFGSESSENCRVCHNPLEPCGVYLGCPFPPIPEANECVGGTGRHELLINGKTINCVGSLLAALNQYVCREGLIVLAALE